MNPAEEKYFSLISKLEDQGTSAGEHPDSEEQMVAMAYEKLKHAILSPLHPPVGDLVSYALGETTPEKTEEINRHLEECALCSQSFAELETEFKEIDSILHKYAAAPVKQTTESSSAPKKKLNRKIYFILAVVLILSGLIIYSRSTEPKYITQAQLRQQPGASLLTRQSPEFRRAVTALKEDDLEEATAALSSDIALHQNDSDIAASYLLLGWTHLQAVHSVRFGLFHSIDRERVKLATRYLSSGLKKNARFQSNDITVNICYSLAVSYLLLEDTTTAREYLRIVLARDGEKAAQAKQLLTQIK
jgi:hypothetical protein